MNKHIVKIKELISDQVDMGTFGLVELELIEMKKQLEQMNSSNDIQNVSEPLGFFVFMDDRYYISEIDGSMLTGWRLTPVGMKHTMTIHEDSVTEYVKSVR